MPNNPEKPAAPAEAPAEPRQDRRRSRRFQSRSRGGMAGGRQERPFDITEWQPKTDLGRRVKAGEITDIRQILERGERILEAAIVDALVPNLENDLIMVGQSKGKFGGGKGSIWKQTQKKTEEGNKPKFTALAIVGNRDGLIGVGKGKAKETVPAREKAIRQAKINLITIRRGSGTWEDRTREPHSIPFKVVGKCGSVRFTLMPAPRGTKLTASPECKKGLQLAGLIDVYSKARGQTKSRLNVVMACFDALTRLGQVKVPAGFEERTRPREEPA